MSLWWTVPVGGLRKSNFVSLTGPRDAELLTDLVCDLLGGEAVSGQRPADDGAHPPDAVPTSVVDDRKAVAGIGRARPATDAPERPQEVAVGDSRQEVVEFVEQSVDVSLGLRLLVGPAHLVVCRTQ